MRHLNVTNQNISEIFDVLVKEILYKELGISKPKRDEKKNKSIEKTKIGKSFNNTLYKYFSK